MGGRKSVPANVRRSLTIARFSVLRSTCAQRLCVANKQLGGWGRCKPPNGVRGEAPKAIAFLVLKGPTLPSPGGILQKIHL